MSVKKILASLLTITISCGAFTPSVFAQDATDSAVIQQSTSPAEPVIIATESAIPVSSVSGSINGDLISDITDQLLTTVTPTIAPSAVLKKKPSLRAFSRKDFRSDERITVTVDDGYADETEVTVFDSNGNEIDVKQTTISVSDPLVYKVSPPREFRPGRFRLKVTTAGGEVSTQDFTWGVLAINPNKSIYKTGETARLAMAVLDEVGQMSCDAVVNLTITDPDGKSIILSTDDDTIIVNPECRFKGYVDKPDFEASYPVGGIGGYAMALHATTDNGQYSITDGFEVREQVAFDVERVSNTRLYPPVTYPMKISVTAAEDFTGTIEEIVPSHIAVSKLDGVLAYDSVKMETIATASAQKEANIPVLGMPADRAHPINLTFGDQLRDPLVKQKYSDFGLLGHDGIDFDMPEGTAVLAVDDGIVVRVDPDGDYGGTIILQHSWGKSYYGHLSTITAQVGDKKKRGLPIGVSGSTGLSTGPHLHFGIKPNVNDPDNGFYGKINPFPYLSFTDSSETFDQDIAGVATPSAEIVQGSDVAVQKISWNVSLTKGQTQTVGYAYQVPNISPQFYTLGPLTFRDQSGGEVFQSTRPWQLAVDVGPGTNTVSPTSGSVSAADQTYTFTFTAAGTMDSGGFTIAVPSGWPDAPQTSSNSTAGYTTAVGNSNATVATVWNNADSTTNWTYDDADYCQGSVTVDTTIKQEGSGSIKCDANGGTPDGGDTFGYDVANQNWSGYTQVAYWIRSDDGRAAAALHAAYDNLATCAGPIEEFNVSALTADTWTYQKHTFTATRTNVDTFCIEDQGGGDLDIVWIDDVLLGPGIPTVTGTGPWTISVRLLDAALNETITVIYGDTSGSAAGDVTNSSTAGVHTFTTQSFADDATAPDSIASQPTVTLSGTGPTLDQLLRHGAWFSAGVEQPFTF